MSMRILITGAGGYFAGELIRQFQEKPEIKIIALSSEPARVSEKYKNIYCISNTELLDNSMDLLKIDVVVHTAFCRKSKGDLLVDSLNFMREIVHWSIAHDVSGFINLSSQSVFGSGEGKLPDESGKMNPGYMYALAKSVSELLLEEMAGKKMVFTNIRLASLIGPGVSVPDNVLYKFICSGLDGKNFKVMGGKQKFSFLDVRDAAEAVRLLIQMPSYLWDSAYNLGPDRQVSILEMADCVCEKIYEIVRKRISYEFSEDDIQLNAGMNSERICKLLGWKPQYSFEMTVKDTIKYTMKYKENGDRDVDAENQFYYSSV